MEKSELPQSKIGSEEPIFASPLLKAGAKIAPHRGRVGHRPAISHFSCK